MNASTRRTFMRAGLAAAAAPLALAQRRRDVITKNVLFLVVDDLRPMLGCYGHPDAVTPHIDALAKRGLTFLNNHCQIASDGPSRQSLFTGLRPDTIDVVDDATTFRRRRPDARTLPQYFRQNGYYAAAVGPVLDDSQSWNEGDTRPVEASLTRSWNSSDVSDADLFDGQTAQRAIAVIERLAGRKFFLAVGLQRPSLPFAAPQSYFNLYPRGYIKALTEPAPKGAPAHAMHDSAELHRFGDVPEMLDAELSRDLVRAYLASVSYVDAQVGLILSALEQQGLRDSTAIVLTSDNGFHLGEFGLWGKHTNFELATRTPLIVSSLGLKSGGRKSRALTELVDVYPTLCEIAGLRTPGDLDGASLASLFENPDQLWKRAVFSQHPREIPGLGPGMGYSMRTSRYRYTEWGAFDSPYRTAELYDYKGQPLEIENLANVPVAKTLANGIAAIMREGWRGSLPPTDPRASANS
ncbi:MAG: sulfatase [Acidobacteria bacterium]|nr:sulfatase [Acidobacteriota bacterium]